MDDAASLKQNKILTVSIAAYNVEKTIEETLRSLLGEVSDIATESGSREKLREIAEQADCKDYGDIRGPVAQRGPGEGPKHLLSRVPAETIGKMEIIVVNDGSKDGTEEVVKKYAELYPESVILINKENGGWGSTVNTSLKMASGKYFRLLDGDDWFMSENLKEYIDFLEKAEADMVLSPFVKRFPDREELSDSHGEAGTGINGMEVLNPDADIYMHELAVRTEKLREGKVQITERCFYTDNEFAFEAIRCSCTVQRFPKPIYIYRLGNSEQSVGLSGILKHYKDTVSVAKKMYESYGKSEAEIYKDKCSKRTEPGMQESAQRNSFGMSEMSVTASEFVAESESGAFKQVKDLILRRKLLLITDSVYVSYLLANTAEAKKELIQFDIDLKKRADIYRLTGENKKIRLLRMTGFILYSYLSRKVRARFS